MSVKDIPTKDRAIALFLERYWADHDEGMDHGILYYAAMFPNHAEAVAAEFLGIKEGKPGLSSGLEVPPAGSLGPYRIEREIGRGGQGTIYLASDTRVDRQVALKVLSGMGTLEGESLNRFHREAEVAARLDHPGICAVFDAGVDGRIPYIAMRYVAGETLDKRIASARSGTVKGAILRIGEDFGSGHPSVEERSGSASPPSDAARREALRFVEFIERAARALHEAHQIGIVHRDIKPGNIMIASRGDPVLLDFGLARDLDSQSPTLTKAGDLFGTPAYMAPEQLAADRVRVDRRADVWSLGVTLYEGLTFHRPFDGPTREDVYQAIRFKDPEDPRRLNPAISGDLKVVMDTALEKDPDRRYQTALDLAEELRRVRESEPIAARPIGTLGRTTRWAKRRPARAALVALVMVGLPTIATLGGILWAHLPEIRENARQKLRGQVEQHLQDGFVYLSEGAANQARDEFEAALALAPDDGEALAGLSLTHSIAQNHDAALAVLDRHSGRDQSDAGLARVRADALARAGRTTEAAEAEAALPPLSSGSDYFLAGYVDLRGGWKSKSSKSGEALAHFTRAVHLAPTRRLLYYAGWAASAAHAKDARVAREAADVVVAIWPNDPWAWSARATALYDSREQQLAAVRRSLELRSSPATLTQLGTLLAVPGHEDEAIDVLLKATRLAPRFSPAWCRLGYLLGSRRDVDGAADAFEHALEIDPTNALALTGKAQLYYEMGDYKSAIKACSKAIAINPDGKSWTLLGASLVGVGHYDEALEAQRKAVEIDPLLPVAWKHLGVSLENHGLIEEAVTAYTKSIELAPEVQTTWNRLADALRHQQHHGEALQTVRRIIRRDPNNQTGWQSLAALEQSLGDFEEAAQSAAEAVRIQPDSKIASEMLATLQPLAEASRRLKRVLGGAEDAPFEHADRDLILRVCRVRRAWHEEAALWCRAFDKNPALADDLEEGLRRIAAKAAVKAGTGRTADVMDEPTRSRWREQAIKWLAADLVSWQRVAKEGVRSKEEVAHSMEALSEDSDLAPVRGSEIARLPEKERAAWVAFWKSVGDLAAR